MSIEAVRALVAERQRYDDWLAALEAKRADTPPRVFDRVQADYVGRRAEVMTRLQAHIGELAAFGSELEQRLGTLETQLAAHEEELAEGMLRNLVGEYDDNRWDAVRRDVEGRIVSLGGERDTLLAEVEDVRTLIDRARMAAPPERAASEPPAAAAVASVEPVADISVAEFTPIAAAEAVQIEDEVLLDIEVPGMVEDAVPEGASRDEALADVAQAAFGEVTGVAEPPFVPSRQGSETDHERRAEADTATSASPAPATDDLFDDLDFLRSVMDEGTDAASPPASAPMAGAGATPSADGGEARKALRCSECGTMNLPTEWYCERCGGELAAF